MSDVFKEQIVKRTPNTKDTLKKAGIIISILIISFVSAFIPYVQSASFIITVALIVGAYFLFSYFDVEYEYIFTNGELDIDIIYSRSRRKRLFSGVVRDFEVMAHVDDKSHVGDFSTAMETKDYSSGTTKPNTYAFLSTYKGKRLKIVVELNDVMLQAFSTSLTSRKFFKKL